jgi:hypothetical protein
VATSWKTEEWSRDGWILLFMKMLWGTKRKQSRKWNLVRGKMDVTSSMTKNTENRALSWYDHNKIMKGKRSPKNMFHRSVCDKQKSVHYRWSMLGRHTRRPDCCSKWAHKTHVWITRRGRRNYYYICGGAIALLSRLLLPMPVRTNLDMWIHLYDPQYISRPSNMYE